MNMNIKSVYDAYWRDRSSQGHFEHSNGISPNEILESVTDLLRGGKKLLDIGCGNGDSIEVIKDKFEKVYGCDISETALHKAMQRGIECTCTDLNGSSRLPYQDESFNNVILLEVLEHLFNPLNQLKEIYRVLKPVGQLILTTPNVRYFRNLYKLIFEGRFPHTTTDNFVWGGGHLHYFTRKDIKLLIKEAGFNRILFHVNQQQFLRSWKRRIIKIASGESFLGEWFCGGIIVEANKL